jgi:hypothetical protein
VREYSIELLDGPEDGEVLDIIVRAANAKSPYPPRLYASQEQRRQICTLDALIGWDPETIADGFHEYHLTDVIGRDNRRIYVYLGADGRDHE